jgi:uncharacterized membrane protein YoaK (UPF0700 family)
VQATQVIELVLLVAGLILIVAGASLARYRYITDRRRARRFYWTTSLVGILCFALGTGQIWPNGVLAALFFAAIVTGSAYLTTPYLKIGGRIYASSAENRQPDPPSEEP